MAAASSGNGGGGGGDAVLGPFVPPWQPASLSLSASLSSSSSMGASPLSPNSVPFERQNHQQDRGQPEQVRGAGGAGADDDENDDDEEEHEAPISGFGLTLVDLITAALALVAALAWNDLARAIFDRLVPEPRNHLLAQTIYVLTLTLVVVMVMWGCRATHRLLCEAGARAERRLNGPIETLLPEAVRRRFFRRSHEREGRGSGGAVRGGIDPRTGLTRGGAAVAASATPVQLRGLRRQAGADALSPSGDGFKTSAVPQGLSGPTRCMLGAAGNGPGGSASGCGARRPIAGVSGASAMAG